MPVHRGLSQADPGTVIVRSPAVTGPSALALNHSCLAWPAGQVLSTRTESKLRELTKIDYRNRAACLVCAIKSRCTKDYRKASRLENEAVLDRMAARRKARPAILDRRREMVAHPFGSIKQWMNQGAFLMRGVDNVRAEFSLTALDYNLRRALNILGVETMMAAVRD
jgi:Transposase DDE domain